MAGAGAPGEPAEANRIYVSIRRRANHTKINSAICSRSKEQMAEQRVAPMPKCECRLARLECVRNSRRIRNLLLMH